MVAVGQPLSVQRLERQREMDGRKRRQDVGRWGDHFVSYINV